MRKSLFGLQDFLGFSAIFIVALLLRTVAIDSQALWADEGQTISLSLFPIWEMFLKPTDPTPFLYYSLHQLFLTPDASVPAMRSISVVFGVLQLIPMYAAGRILFGRAGGLLAAALLAVWSSHVDYSMEARTYGLFGFVTLVGFTGLILFLRTAATNGSRRELMLGLALFAVGNVLSFYAHMISVFSIGGWSLLLAVYAVTAGRQYLRPVAATFAVMAVCAIPGMIRAVTQIEVGHDFNWLSQPGPGVFVSTLGDFFLPIGFWDNPLTTALGIRLPVKAAFIIVFALAIGTILYRNRAALAAFAAQNRFIAALLLLTFLLLPVIWLTGYVIKPLFLGRLTLFAIPAAILVAVMIVTAQPERLRRAASLGLIGIWLFSTLAYGMMREKEDFRGANRFLAAAMGPDDAVLVCPSFYFPALRHAARGTLGRLVLATNAHDDRLTLLEPGLGASRTWAQDYFVSLQRFRSVPEQDVQFAPGQSIWRLDGSCWQGLPESDRLDALLAAVDPAPEAAWSQKAKYYDHLVIRRYRVSAPVTLKLRLGYGSWSAGLDKP